jgi:23S rRNA pseudouridine955/2504/2580 synthase/23S rRNA pseudouridine1911/1915/1917 synthase
MKRKLKWRIESTGTEIVYEDDDLVALNKPAGFLALPDRYNAKLPSLYGILAEELGKIFVVHRIDKETSGIIVFAKTAEAHAALNEQFEGRRVEKVYQALVTGTPATSDGTIDLPLGESSRDRGVVKVDRKTGKESVTQYKVLEQFNGFALLEARPRTGRMHQIRVHLQAIGLPILADRVYGNGKGFYLSHIKAGYKMEGEEKPLLDRTALHAALIAFDHPAAGGRMTFSAPLPKDMSSVLKYLRKFKALELRRMSPGPKPSV